MVVPNTKIVDIQRRMGSDGSVVWYAILLGGKDEHQWFPEAALADFTADSCAALARPEVEKGVALAKALAPLSYKRRVGEFIKIRRKQEKSKVLGKRVSR